MPARTVVLLLLAGAAPMPAQELADVFDRVAGSVVTLRVMTSRPGGAPDQPVLEWVIGSGLLLDRDGTILTAAHVVEQAEQIAVQFRDGTERPGSVVISEPGADLALVRVRGELPATSRPGVLGDSSRVRVGDPVFVVGAPMGMTWTLTAGHIAAKRRNEDYLASMHSIEHLQTDAAINPGNSGGPLFDRGGEVVGIACHLVTSRSGGQGLGFAVSTNAVRELLLERPKVWLGFDALPLSRALARALNVPDSKAGLLVTRVARSSLADRAGLRPGTILARIADSEVVLGGDVILDVQGIPLDGPMDLQEARKALQSLGPDDVLQLSVLREGKLVALRARVVE